MAPPPATTGSETPSTQQICIIGAGLSGAMMAVMLSRRGFQVHLFEKRSDFREPIAGGAGAESSTATTDVFGLSKESTKRSINLALSHRGRMALKQIGLDEQVMQFAIPMHGRAIHLSGSSCSVAQQPYGAKDQAIYSVSRSQLNALLLASAEKMANVSLYFNHSVVSVSAEGEATFSTGKKQHFDLVIGADGAYSSVRASMSRHCRQNFSQFYIPHGYKELSLPATSTGEYALTPANALHIWPREKFMLIALPNPDKSFTCTLFAPYEGEGGLNALISEEQVAQHFERYFPDVLHCMPNYIREYLTNPTGALATMRVDPWNVQAKMLLIGDAAHAIVPFYGQGMNSGFEDCLVFHEMLDVHLNSLSRAVPAFAALRKPQADALADLSFDNYVEMRAHTASWTFRIQKRLEAILHRFFPTYWIPLYTMVSFTRIPYVDATARAQKQDKWIAKATKGLVVAAALLLLRLILPKSAAAGYPTVRLIKTD